MQNLQVVLILYRLGMGSGSASTLRRAGATLSAAFTIFKQRGDCTTTGATCLSAASLNSGICSGDLAWSIASLHGSGVTPPQPQPLSAPAPATAAAPRSP